MIMANMSVLKECGNEAYNLMLDADWGSADAPPQQVSMAVRTDIHLPVTSLYSSRVAKIISKSEIVGIHKPATKRPWFL